MVGIFLDGFEEGFFFGEIDDASVMWEFKVRRVLDLQWRQGIGVRGSLEDELFRNRWQ